MSSPIPGFLCAYPQALFSLPPPPTPKAIPSHCATSLCIVLWLRPFFLSRLGCTIGRERAFSRSRHGEVGRYFSGHFAMLCIYTHPRVFFPDILLAHLPRPRLGLACRWWFARCRYPPDKISCSLTYPQALFPYICVCLNALAFESWNINDIDAVACGIVSHCVLEVREPEQRRPVSLSCRRKSIPPTWFYTRMTIRGKHGRVAHGNADLRVRY